MAGRTNYRKHSKIKKCQPEDKKDGRKHPKKDQKFCLWDSNGDEILYAAPSRQDAEGQERSVQYHSHNGSVLLNGQVFCRALVQAAVPGDPPFDLKMKKAYTTEEVEQKLGPWLKKFFTYATAVVETQDDLLKLLAKQPSVLKQMYSRYPSLVEAFNANKLNSVSSAYGDIGMGIVEMSNSLLEVVRHRRKSKGYLKKVAPAMEKLPDGDPMKNLYEDIAEILSIEEVAA